MYHIIKYGDDIREPKAATYCGPFGKKNQVDTWIYLVEHLNWPDLQEDSCPKCVAAIPDLAILAVTKL